MGVRVRRVYCELRSSESDELFSSVPAGFVVFGPRTHCCRSLISNMWLREPVCSSSPPPAVLNDLCNHKRHVRKPVDYYGFDENMVTDILHGMECPLLCDNITHVANNVTDLLYQCARANRHQQPQSQFFLEFVGETWRRERAENREG